MIIQVKDSIPVVPPAMFFCRDTFIFVAQYLFRSKMFDCWPGPMWWPLPTLAALMRLMCICILRICVFSSRCVFVFHVYFFRISLWRKTWLCAIAVTRHPDCTGACDAFGCKCCFFVIAFFQVLYLISRIFMSA